MAYKRQLRVLGLLLVTALSGIALFTTSASALWLESGAAINSNKTVEFGMHAEGKILVEKETDLEILCNSIGGSGFQLNWGTSEAKGSVLFTGCKTWQGGVDITKKCKPVEPIVATGTAILILSASKNYILVGPTIAGGNLAVIKFSEALGCALLESNNVKGTMVFECLKASNLEAIDCKQEEVVRLVRPNETFADKLTYGIKAAKLTGVASANLPSGNAWCGHI